MGYAEIFDRFFDIISFVPQGKDDRDKFYLKLIADVAVVNANDNTNVNKFIKQCMTDGKRLRYLETLIKMESDEKSEG